MARIQSFIPADKPPVLHTIPPPTMSPPPLLLFTTTLLLLLLLPFSFSQPFIGVNYGQVADNLPSPDATSRLLQSTTISKVRLYGADPSIIRSLANTNISILLGAANADIPALAADPTAAANWVAANVLPFLPASSISAVSVGNEVLTSNDPALSAALLPAMQNVATALSANAASSTIKVTTVHSMAVLGQSDPPSSGAFVGDLNGGLKAILGFLDSTGSAFMVNPYPFFAYRSDPRPETIAFCLFQQNAGRYDSGTKITYMNMFDAQLDAIRSAVNAAGFPNAGIAVAETGWPYRGDSDEVGATVDNAQAFVSGLVEHLRSGSGTPLMPGREVDTYIFALYDEDLKPGPTSERSFGLFRPDLTAVFDAGLAKATTSTNGTAKRPSAAAAGWCVARDGATDVELQEDLDYACGQKGVDCQAIQPGGTCYQPNTVRSHAAYAMNQLYQASGKQSWNCDFRSTAVLSSDNPSYDSCVYPGS